MKPISNIFKYFLLCPCGPKKTIESYSISLKFFPKIIKSKTMKVEHLKKKMGLNTKIFMKITKMLLIVGCVLSSITLNCRSK